MDPRPFRLVESIKVKAPAQQIPFIAAILACAVWTAVGGADGALARAAWTVLPGFQKGNDFVQFYVAGSLAPRWRFSAPSASSDRFR